MNDGDTIDAQLLDLMLRTGSQWVLWLLLALSLGSIAIVIDRIWFYVTERPPREAIAAAVALLRDGNRAAALGRLKNMPSMEAAVARAILAHADAGVAAVEEHKSAAIEKERLRYERLLAF